MLLQMRQYSVIYETFADSISLHCFIFIFICIMTDEMTFVYQNITSYQVMLQLVLLQRTESNEQTKHNTFKFQLHIFYVCLISQVSERCK